MVLKTLLLECRDPKAVHVMPTCVVQVFYHSKFTLEFFCGLNYVIISLVIYMLERSKMLINNNLVVIVSQQSII